MISFITDEVMEEALHYLLETDEEAARVESYFNGLEDQAKTVYSLEFLETTGNVEERKCLANSSQSVIDNMDKIRNANLDHKILRNKRQTRNLLIEVWRSVNSNRRQGKV